MSTTVSIIIPAFQNAMTIGRSLNSVRDQTHAGWEAIVACDGSTDGTAAIAERFAQLDDRIRVLLLEHRGVSPTRNSAIRESRGDWLLFLDADDTIDPAYLRHMLARARTRPEAGVIACGYKRIDELARVTTRYAPLPLHRDPLLVCAAGPPGAIHSFLVRRELVVAVAGFDETLRTNEDWDLWLRIAQSGARFAITRRRLANYWLTPNSLSRSGRQMVRDSGIVQLRAHRLHVAPRRGLETFDRTGFTLDDFRLRDAIWSAGVTIGQAKPVNGLFDEIAPDVEHRHQKSVLVGKLFDGLVVGTGTGYRALGLRWPGIGPGIEDMFAQLGQHLGDQDMRPLAQALQVEVIRSGRFVGQIDLGLVSGVSLTLDMILTGYVASSDVDLVIFRATWLRPATVFSFAAPLLGRLTARDIRRLIVRGFGRRVGTRLGRSERAMAIFARYWRATALGRRLTGRKRVEPPRIPVLSAAHAGAATPDAPIAQPAVAAAAIDRAHPGVGSDAAQWDRFFSRENPWRYDSAYEQVKYDRTIGLLSPTAGAALEIACAEGHFTARLASVAGSVHACDISRTALDRAGARNRHCDTVTYEQRDVFQDGIDGQWDIVTCSEMLYFVPSIDALRLFANHVAAALRPGGQFVHAHAFVAHERPQRTAFDWCDTVGADGIFAVLIATPGLRHARAIVTDLYRIDLFIRDDNPQGEPIVEICGLGCTLEPDVAGDVLWHGAIIGRQQAERRRAYRIPVLLYHGVDDTAAADDFCVTTTQLDHQLRFLRRRGYRSIDADRWREGAARAGSLRGRPVMITFDGLTDTFLEHAWPVIRRNGFSAHVFVTADQLDCVGTIVVARLIAEGVTFGSQLTGVAADFLPSRDLLQTALAARAALHMRLGRSITSIAPPEGMSDTRIEMILAAAGFNRLFLDDGEAAWVCGLEMRTPRVEILRAMSMDQFALGVRASEAPEPADHPLFLSGSAAGTVTLAIR